MQLPQESVSGEIRRFHRHVVGHVTLENVSFRYGAQGIPALRGVDLDIPAGCFIAIQGEPGAGRSTLLKLIANQYAPTFGRIRIDGLDARQFDIRELRRAIALVNDEEVVFSGTLADNLRFANPLASEEQIHAAIDQADLSTFVADLPDGLDTDLGVLLSDGLEAAVRQKIRLARAYLQGPPIYLLDGPEVDLDQPGQSALIDALETLKGRATLVVVTAHQQIIELADRTVTMDAGRIQAPASGVDPALRRLPAAKSGTSRAALGGA